jgi:hypothetical protein
VSFVQVIEGYHVADLMWGTSFGVPVTLSFWFRTNAPTGSVFNVALGMFGAQAQYLTTVTAPPGTWQYQTISVPPPPNGTSFNSGTAGGVSVHIAPYGLVQTGTGWNATGNAFTTQGSYNWPGLAGNFIHVTGVQLEKGTVATPFEFRNYAQELALCQRYYQVFGPGNTTGYSRFGAGTLNLAYQGFFAIPLQVSMRAAPTVFSNSAVSTFSVSSGGASQPVTVLGFSDASYTSFSCAATTGVNVNTQGFGCLLIGNNSTSAFIGVSAEL